jgi:hypothetical protein
MKHLLLITLVTFLIIAKSKAQVDDSALKRNGFYAEIYTIRHDFNSGIASFNYERIVGVKRKVHLRAGLYPDFKSTLSIPLTVTWVTSPLKKHHFEFGLGLVYRIEYYPSIENPDRDFFYDVPAAMFPFMYRYQSNKGFFFRGGINLFYSWPILPAPSFSIGHRF